MKQKKFLRVLAYVGAALFGLVVGLYATFPSREIGTRLQAAVGDWSQGALSLRFEELSLSGISGLRVDGVRVSHRDGWELPLAYAEGRIRLLPLLVGRKSIDIELGDLRNGVLEAEVTPLDERAFSLKAQAAALDMQAYPMLKDMLNLPLAGTVNGDVELDWRPQELKTSLGKINLQLSGAALGPATISGFGVPNVGLGNLSIGLAMKEGRVEVETFEQQGGDVSAQASGGANLRSRLGMSAVDMCLQFKVAEDFLAKNPKVSSALELAQMRLKKDDAGFLHVPLSGSIARPRVRDGLCR